MGVTELTRHPTISSIHGDRISIVRMRSDRSDHEESGPIPCSDAFSVIVQLQRFESHRLWRGRRMVYDGGHAPGALSITYLGEEWRCHHRSPFDNIRFNITRQTLDEFAHDVGRPVLDGLSCGSGRVDPVVQGLANALLPALAKPGHASSLFIDHISLALQAHLVSRYGGLKLPGHAGGLSARQLKVATAFLAAKTARDVKIADVAGECGLSASYFIRAFKKATGRTPHRWLLEYRAEKARQMLLGEFSIAEIAIACGFADQSHLTRVFTSLFGISPGLWRRQRRI